MGEPSLCNVSSNLSCFGCGDKIVQTEEGEVGTRGDAGVRNSGEFGTVEGDFAGTVWNESRLVAV
jgi:hypothetical protein